MLYFLLFLGVVLSIFIWRKKQPVVPTLMDTPTRKGTVGIVPVHVVDNELYILLGRESAKADAHKAYQFSEFGGATIKNQTFLHNLLREAYEESCGLLHFQEEEILKNSQIFYLDRNNRDIFYVMHPVLKALTNKEFKAAQKKFTDIKYHEKDEIEWICLSDLLKYKTYLSGGFCVKNIDGKSIRIKIRPYFWNDFILTLKQCYDSVTKRSV
ncbi:MAG: hypothetical protein NEHIOOID_00131 [Holosporales bacterium]